MAHSSPTSPRQAVATALRGAKTHLARYWVGYVAVVVAGTTAYFLTSLLAAGADVLPALQASAALLAVVLSISVVLTIRNGDLFAASAFPLLYSSSALILPMLLASVDGFGATFLTNTLITPRLILSIDLFVAALAVALLIPARPWVREQRDPIGEPRPFLMWAGTAIIILGTLLRLGGLAVFGVGSFDVAKSAHPALQSQLSLYASLLPLAGVLVVLLGRRNDRRTTVIGPVPLAILALWAVCSLLTGSRDELIAPAVVLVWAYHRRVAPIRTRVVVGVAAVGFILLAVVGVVRSAGPGNGILADLLRPVSSATNTTSLVVRQVPDHSDYLHGQTYLDSLRYALPGMGAPSAQHANATLRFPRTINFTAPSGLGFSPAAEAYWNFGLAGLVLIPLLYGVVLRTLEGGANAWAARATDILYPLVIARLATNLRGDFLQFYKGILLPFIGIAVLLWIDNRWGDPIASRARALIDRFRRSDRAGAHPSRAQTDGRA